MPTSSRFVENYGYRSRFSHEHETGSPGHYSVLLETNNVFAELATGSHFSGSHRYRWQQSGGKHVILFPISHAMPQKGCVNASVDISLSSQLVTGWIFHKGSFGGRGNGVHPYFAARFNESFVRYGTWDGGHISAGSSNVTGAEVGGWIEFEASAVEMTVGVSWLSQEQAIANLKNAPGSFDEAVQLAQQEWSSLLGSVVVADATADKDDLRKFYTGLAVSPFSCSFLNLCLLLALYHIYCAPSTVSESGGVFLAFDHQQHTLKAPQRAYYSDMSIWVRSGGGRVGFPSPCADLSFVSQRTCIGARFLCWQF